MSFESFRTVTRFVVAKKAKAKIKQRNNNLYEYYVNYAHTNEMKVWSSQLWLGFEQSQLSPTNVFGASTGFEPMAIIVVLHIGAPLQELTRR